MKKRFFVSLFVLMMLAVLVPLSVSASGESIDFAAGSTSQTLEAGSTVLVPVNVTSNPGYLCGTVAVKWDKTALALTRVDYATAAPDHGSPEITENRGVYYISFGDAEQTSNFSNTGLFFTLTFEITDTAKVGGYDITLSEDRSGVYDNSVNYVPQTFKNGKVTLTSPLKITENPKDVSVYAGDSVSFTAAAEGNGLSYQWYYKKADASAWSKWNGRTTATTTATANATWNGMQVYCVVTDSNNNTVSTSAATITILEKLAITQQPENVTVKSGATATFTVKATGSDLTYQWYIKKVGADWKAWNGHTTASISAAANDTWNGMQVRCVVKDGTGKSVTSNAATITIGTPALAITAHPADVTVKSGANATFTVKATGDGLKYQWYYKKAAATDWSVWNGRTTASTTATANDTWNGMQVRCVVKDSSGKSVTSNAAMININGKLTIVTQPANVTVKSGANATFTVKAAGASLKYQWYYKKSGATSWSVWNGRTTASTTATANDSWNGMQVRCIVKDGSGNSVTSNAATITIGTAATFAITSHPANVTVKSGDTATFTVKATGTGLTYQWYIKKSGADWKAWNGHTTASTSAAANDSWNGMQVRCIVKDGSGNSLTSNAATVSISK